MDPITSAALDRAYDALSLARSHGRTDPARAELERAVREYGEQRSATPLTSDDGVAGLYAHVVGSTPHANLLDALIASGAVSLTPAGGTMIATALLPGDAAAEGAPIPVRTLAFDAASVVTVEASAIVATSTRLWRDPRVQVAVTREVMHALHASVNAHLLADVTQVPATGDIEADLRIGLAAAPHASSYVIAASPGDTALLALSPANIAREAGVSGGRLADGLLLVPVLGIDGLWILPASRLGFVDLGVHLTPSGEAKIDLRDDPTAVGSPETVDAYQRNLMLLRATREFGVVQGSPAIQVVSS